MNMKIPSAEEIAARLQLALASYGEAKPQPPETQCASTGCAYQSSEAEQWLRPIEALPPSGRRSSIYTPETIARILFFVEKGYTETAACKQAGVIPNGWAKLKGRRADIRERVTAARQSAIRTRLEREQ